MSTEANGPRGPFPNVRGEVVPIDRLLKLPGLAIAFRELVPEPRFKLNTASESGLGHDRAICRFYGDHQSVKGGRLRDVVLRPKCLSTISVRISRRGGQNNHGDGSEISVRSHCR